MSTLLTLLKTKKWRILLLVLIIIFFWMPQIFYSQDLSWVDEFILILGYEYYIFIIYIVLVFILLRLVSTIFVKFMMGSPIKNLIYILCILFILAFILQFFISNRELLHTFYNMIQNPDPFVRSIITTYCITIDSLKEIMNLLKKEKLTK